MSCQRDCFNCGSEDNVRWYEHKKEFYCEDCIELEKEDLK